MSSNSQTEDSSFESKIDQEIESIYEPLKQAIIEIIKEEGTYGLGQRFAILNISSNKSKELIESNYDSQKCIFRYKDFYNELIEQIVENQKRWQYYESDFAFNLLPESLKIVTKSTTEILFKCHTYLCLKFLESSTRDANTIKQYHKILFSKKRSLLTRDQWGDPDETRWILLLEEFSREKLEISKTEAQYSILTSITPHLQSVNQYNAGIKWLFVMLESLENTSELKETIIKTGLDFEDHLFKKAAENFPNASIEKTPTTGDQGADLVISSPTKKIVVQAKYYSSTVGNSAVQEVFSAKSYYDADECIVVSQNGYTSSAKVLASKTGVFLVTTEDFIEILKEIANDLN